MPDWRDRILKALTPGIARLTMAVDPDGLLLEATLLEAIRERGFEIVTFEDPVAFRFDAEGRGRPAEGAIAEVRGERARIYPDPVLRSRVKERFPDAIEWPSVGLSEDCLALLAPGRTAFVREGERIVGHGGVSLEEVVVPMVEIERAAA